MEIANKPMTLEQLREMRENTEIIGPSVRISWNGVMVYGVLDECTDDGLCAVVGVGVWLKEKDYGKTWLAYAQQPAHIDREKWGGSWEGEADGYADGELVYDTWRCSGCGHTEETDDPNWLPDFCPDCGRAMKDKALAELERRLMG